MSEAPPKKKENPWIGIIVSLVIPILILKKLSGADMLGPVGAVLLAIAFPIGDGIFEFVKTRKLAMIPILGLINVLLTGGFVIFEVGGIWFAVKEAAIPGAIAIAVFVSKFWGKPLVKQMFYSEQILNIGRIEEALDEAHCKKRLDTEWIRANFLVAISFVLSSILNFFFAYYIVTAAPGTEAFNDQVGTMQGVSFLAIMLSCTSLMVYALYRVLNELRQTTGLAWEELLRQQ